MVLWCALIPTLSRSGKEGRARNGNCLARVHRLFYRLRRYGGGNQGGIAPGSRSRNRGGPQCDLSGGATRSGNDPSYGIEHLTTIGWTSISTAKSNPFPGLLVIQSLRALLARWSAEQADDEAEERATPKLPVVYTDNVFARLLGSFETLAVVTSESMQPQTMAEIIRTFAVMFERLSAHEQVRATDIILRILSVLGDHVL